MNTISIYLHQIKRRVAHERLPPVVLKFGGTSVGDAFRYRTVLERIEKTSAQDSAIVIVSAMSGVTDNLVAATKEKDDGFVALDIVAKLFDRYSHHAAIFLQDVTLSRYNAFSKPPSSTT